MKARNIRRARAKISSPLYYRKRWNRCLFRCKLYMQLYLAWPFDGRIDDWLIDQSDRWFIRMKWYEQFKAEKEMWR